MISEIFLHTNLFLVVVANYYHWDKEMNESTCAIICKGLSRKITHYKNKVYIPH